MCCTVRSFSSSDSVARWAGGKHSPAAASQRERSDPNSMRSDTRRLARPGIATSRPRGEVDSSDRLETRLACRRRRLHDHAAERVADQVRALDAG